MYKSRSCSPNEQVRLLLAQEVHDRANRIAIDQVAPQFDAVTLRLGSCLVLKFFIKLQPVLFQDPRDRTIGNSGEGSMCGKVRHRGDCQQFSIETFREFDGGDKGSL